MGTLQRPSQTQTPTDVPTDLRNPYPETFKKIPQTPLKDVNPLGSSSPVPMQPSPPQETCPTREVTGLLRTLRLLGVPVALVTDPFSSGQGSRGFNQVPPSAPRPYPSQLPPNLARAPLIISAGVPVSSPRFRLAGKACHHTAPCSWVSSTTFLLSGLALPSPSFRQDPDLRTCKNQAKAQRYVASYGPSSKPTSHFPPNTFCPFPQSNPHPILYFSSLPSIPFFTRPIL